MKTKESLFAKGQT